MVDNQGEWRLSFHEAKAALSERLREPPRGVVQLLAGPRQVGKTTLVLALAKRAGARAIYAAADAPEASLPGFWERIWSRAEEIAADRGEATVFLDEVHLFSDWAARLKGVVDRHRRTGAPIRVVATGSSALHLTTGSRESLAGRFERITLTHWSASSVARAFRLSPRAAADAVVRFGSYPGAFRLRRNHARWSAYVRDAILEPAIGKDVLALGAVRKPALLRQIMGVALAAPAQIVSLQKIQGQLHDKGALETIQQYLTLLEEALLVTALEKHSSRDLRLRAAPPKLVVLNNALVTAVDARDDPARRGALVENACLAHAWNRGQRVRYWREEPLEVDAVIDGSWGAHAVEVKTGPYEARDLVGLLELVKRYPALRPVVLCDDAHTVIAERVGVRALPWRTFLTSDLSRLS